MMILVLLICVALPCLTVAAVAGAVLYVHMKDGPTKTVREAEAAVTVARMHTTHEFELWKQDWILEQRSKNSPPQLPPGAK